MIDDASMSWRNVLLYTWAVSKRNLNVHLLICRFVNVSTAQISVSLTNVCELTCVMSKQVRNPELTLCGWGYKPSIDNNNNNNNNRCCRQLYRMAYFVIKSQFVRNHKTCTRNLQTSRFQCFLQQTRDVICIDDVCTIMKVRFPYKVARALYHRHIKKKIN